MTTRRSTTTTLLVAVGDPFPGPKIAEFIGIGDGGQGARAPQIPEKNIYRVIIM